MAKKLILIAVLVSAVGISPAIASAIPTVNLDSDPLENGPVFLRPTFDTRFHLEFPLGEKGSEIGYLRNTLSIVNDLGKGGRQVFRAYAGPRLSYLYLNQMSLTIQGGLIAGWFGSNTVAVLVAAEFEIRPDEPVELAIRVHGYFDQMQGDLFGEYEILVRPYKSLRIGFLADQINEKTRVGPLLGFNIHGVLEIKAAWLFGPCGKTKTHSLHLKTTFRLPRTAPRQRQP